jgi:hypothetical protein
MRLIGRQASTTLQLIISCLTGTVQPYPPRTRMRDDGIEKKKFVQEDFFISDFALISAN